jgi:hypothetical protein
MQLLFTIIIWFAFAFHTASKGPPPERPKPLIFDARAQAHCNKSKHVSVQICRGVETAHMWEELKD